jgi:hypothetical protein
MLPVVLFIYLLVGCFASCKTRFRHYHPRHAVWIGCETETEAGREMIEQVVRSTVRDYTYIRQVEIMCNLVLTRLSFRGIIIPNKTSCTNATIESNFSSTLSELYNNFYYLEHNVATKSEKELERNQLLCSRRCNVDDLLGPTTDLWIRQHAPDLSFPDCVYKKWSFDDGFTLKLDNEGWSKKCEPLRDFNPNTTDWNFTLVPSARWERCLECLEETERLLFIAQDIYIKQGRMHALLIPEISGIWRNQMPYILSKAAKMLKLTDE